MNNRSPRQQEPSEASSRNAARARAGNAGWGAITLLPNPLPGFEADDVDTTVHFLGRDYAVPLLIQARGIDSADLAALAPVAERSGAPLATGSLMPLFDGVVPVSTVVAYLDSAPSALILGEIPVSRLGDLESTDIRAVAAALRLGGLIISLDTDEAARNGQPVPEVARNLERIGGLVRALRLPTVVRAPTGLARWTSRTLIEKGAAGLMVGGTEVAGERDAAGHNRHPSSSVLARPWGLPTIAAIRMLRSIGVPVISQGRIPTGLDAAKAIALGADLLTPSLVPVGSSPRSSDVIQRRLDRYLAELQLMMFLAGARQIAGLKQVPFIAVGQAREWLEAAEMLWRPDVPRA